MNLTKDSLAVDLILEDTLHPLDGHLFARRLVNGTRNGAIRSLAEQLDTLILLADFPVGKFVHA